jgi:hypothetical protein
MWIFGGLLFALWFVLTFLLHKHGFVPMILLAAISVLIIEFTKFRKAGYHNRPK